MFVGDVEVIQLPENMALASTVRLHPTNELFNVCSYSLKKFGASSIGHETGGIPAYWEVGFPQYVISGCGIRPLHESGSKTVQCAPKIVNNVSDIPTEID